jgi:hypothetical protein
VNTPFEETNFLVVECYINIGQGPTTIRLTRTIKANSKETITGESGADVNIEDDNGTMYSLVEKSDGTYAAPLNLSNENQYRIHITTSTGKTSISELSSPMIRRK